jgi:hypothetical protein
MHPLPISVIYPILQRIIPSTFVYYPSHIINIKSYFTGFSLISFFKRNERYREVNLSHLEEREIYYKRERFRSV